MARPREAIPLAARVAVALVLACSPLGAQDKPASPPATTPLPPARPEGLTPVEPAPAPAAGAGLPRPPERPPELSTSPAAAPAPPDPAAAPNAADLPLPPPRPPELSGAAALALKVQAPDDTACKRRLESLGATFETLAPIASGQCGADKPLKLSSLRGSVALDPPATLVCGAAEALTRWATEVQVAAERELGKPLASLSIGTSYECRGQNHDVDAKLSEHAFANGIDVMGYGFAGRAAVTVGTVVEGTPEASFQAAVRAKACGFFRTVLGPGSDAAHANHLHLDERERGAGHRLCQ